MSKVVRCFGYARGSDAHRQEESPTRQEAAIQARVKQLEKDLCPEGGEVRFVKCYCELASGSKIRYDERPVFKRLMAELREGDHLFVWRLDRLDRNPFGMVRVIEWLVNQGVCLHVLEFGGQQLDLNTAMGRTVVLIMAVVADMFVEQLRRTQREVSSTRKSAGLPINGLRRYGYRRVWTDPDHNGKRHIIRYERDTGEIALIREMWEKHRQGWKYAQIAADLGRRNKKTAEGEPWTKRDPRGYWRSASVRSAILAYEQALLKGEEL